MQSEDRLIHFSTELIHAPRQHARPALQKLYYELSQTRHGAYDNTDFSHPTHARFHSRRGAKAQSAALFLPDRVVLIEEWVEIALSEFSDRVDTVAQHVLSDLGVGSFVAQSATLRSTFALTHYPDARQFLIERVCGQGGQIDPYFRRPIATGGLRFALPESTEHGGNLNVIVESYRNSASEVFVEVKGVFANRSVDGEDLEKLREPISICREFITDSVFPFLDQYDTPKVDPV
ncbi:MAG: hypothetical protein QGG73_00645 [Candidatus Hydrogenedentes bacterium]|jgi:hypothetical protein|nr:hypothetical protein [Candidatus Hydrogenedentota bacterium]